MSNENLQAFIPYYKKKRNAAFADSMIVDHEIESKNVLTLPLYV